jgi:signal transduction histidine kinase
LKIVHLQAKQAGIKLDVNLPSSLPHIEADRRACKQMLLNLLTNAIKFTPKGGSITIASAVVGQELLLEVKDNGVGIPPQALRRLGQPFEQAVSPESDASISRAQAGTGLGLALVKSMARLHGGEMEIASRLGEGTIVQVSFPLTQAKGVDLRQTSSKEGPDERDVNLERDVPDHEPVSWPHLKGAA